ncbi:hypothetical protein BGZ58_007916 [Dissophora ornata]|nr:hypothetical protein BGZ58_007916 [Dissophora ornata]
MINPRQHFPEPIIFQYTLYYPGNIPLVITAGHGGSTTPGKPVKSKVTHRFVRVPDLELTTLPIEVSTFSVPVSSGEEDEEEEVMPWMPPRDQTKGGNFKMDLNTHATALNIANAVACLTSGIGHDRGRNGEGLQREDNNMTKSIPEGCEGPWGDRDSDFPFPPSPSPSSSYLQQQATAASASSSGNTRTKRSQGSRVYNYPHLVVFRVPRLFVDVNRNVTGENAIADHPVSEAAWREYHDVVDHVQKMILQQREREQKGKKPETESDTPTFPSGPGLLLDIHGHVHATNLIEIGYLMNGSVLAMDDEQLDTHAHMLAKESSIRSLVSRVTVANDGASSAPVLPTPPSTQISLASGRHCQDQQEDDKENSKLAFSTLLRGRNDSLGGMLQAQGLNSLPSPEHLAPCQECIFFFGGYTIQAHGTRDREYSTDAIQLELPRTLRLVAKEEGREIGMQLGKAVVEYMAKHYGVFEEYVSANSSSDAKSTFTAASVRNGVASRVGMREAGAKRVALERSMSQPYRPAAAATGLHSYHRTRSESRENHSGDSDIEDGMASSNRHPEMKRQSSRL